MCRQAMYGLDEADGAADESVVPVVCPDDAKLAVGGADNLLTTSPPVLVKRLQSWGAQQIDTAAHGCRRNPGTY